MLIKDSEHEETVEEVFDRTTVMTIYKLMNAGVIGEFKGVVSAGKEARVYAATDSEGNPIAVKIFLTKTAEFRRGRMKYILGDPRFEGMRLADRNIVYAWAAKEYKNLKLAYEAGAYVPRPIKQEKNVLVMEFIGENFTPAPILKDLPRVTEYMFLQVLRQVRILYRRAGLVHADLSEYNIFYYKRKPILFDFGQAVLTSHPNAEAYLVRDISNVIQFFRERGVAVLDLDTALEYVKA
ncbi:serine protein kinase RIO [Candidatus Geothermarchaeota archaeon ex4572_27]|nr:MAG: serine protein kinase RIO [Candidatus Geothermarchaeota archaeon ex4572_27]